MTIQKEVKVVISAVDQYSSVFSGFNTKAIALVVGAVEAIAAAFVAASIEAGQFAAKLGGEVFQSAADFNDAMYNVEAVAQSFGTSGDQILGILDDMTAKFPVTGKQAGDALQLIAQLGYGSEEQLRQMADAANVLQIATGADLQTGIMGTLAILNSFGLEANEAQRVVNLLAAAAFTSAANVEDLGISLRYAAPIASLMGISVEETVAAIAQLRDRGLEASQTGTTLRMALIQLGKETQDKTEILKKYGLTYDDVNPKIQGITGIIEAFNGQLIDGADAAVLFGTRSVAFANIINMGADAFKSYTGSITGTTAAYDAFEKKMQTWAVVQKQVAGDMDRLKNTIGQDFVQAILHAIGTSDTEGIRGLLNYLIKIEKMTGSWGDAFIEPIERFGEALERMIGGNTIQDWENVYNTISKLAYLLSQNLLLLETWGEMFANLGLGMVDELQEIRDWLTIVNVSFGLLVSPIFAIRDAFALMVNAVHGLVYVVKLGYNELGKLFADVLRNSGELLGMIPGMGGWAEDLIQDADRLTAFYDNNIQKAKELFDRSEMGYWLDDLVHTIDAAQAEIDSMEGPKPASWASPEGIKEAAGKVADDLIDGIRENLPQISDAAEEMWKKFLPTDSVQLDAFLPKISDVQDGVKAFSDQLQTSLSDTEIEKLFVPEFQPSFFEAPGVIDKVTGSFNKFSDGLDLSLDLLNYSDEALKKIHGEMGIVGDKSVEVAEKLKEIKPPPDLIFNHLTGQFILMEGAVNDSVEAIGTLDKNLDAMTDREFSIYTEKFKADLQLASEQAKQTHEVILKNIEWKAKLDIEDVKANAEILKAAFEAVGESVKATAGATSDMFGELAGLLGGDKWLSSTTENWLKKQVEDQMELQRAALAIEKTLTEAQARNLDARTEKIKNLNKEAMITVDGDGLKPHLEAMMWEVFQAIQIRATEEGLDKLLLGGALSATE
jgi:TP901 family phage tail tape measure protein